MVIEIVGKYARALVYKVDGDVTSSEAQARAQIHNLCNCQAAEGTKICIMPDFHTGVGCVVGLTMAYEGEITKVMPNMVGVDIGCGVLAAKIGDFYADFEKLDTVMDERVPTGFAVHEGMGKPFDLLKELVCAKDVDLARAYKSLGTLGGGNHFIEVAEGETGYYLLVHSGSRRLGLEICNWYLRKGARPGVPRDLTYVEGALLQNYLHDMQIAQEFACANREAIAEAIAMAMDWQILDKWESVHNYIDLERRILRKGAISALSGQKVLVPINMRDGSLVGVGKGAKKWNFSAPHGAGRVASRSAIKKAFTVADFEVEMGTSGVYTSCVSADTLDEAPFAYRNMQDIRAALAPTVDVTEVLRPLYNFKAGG